MAGKCPTCKAVVKHPDCQNKYLPEDRIPEEWKCKRATLQKYTCKPCDKPFIKAIYQTNDDKEYPQRHVLVDEQGNHLWRLGVFEKPNSNGEKPYNSCHCRWTDDVSADVSSKFDEENQNKITRRERRFMTIFKTREGKTISWDKMAHDNRERVGKLHRIEEAARKALEERFA